MSISPDPPTQSKKPVAVYIGGCNVTQGGAERTHTQGIVHYLRKHTDLYFIGGYDAGSQPVTVGLLPSREWFLPVSRGLIGKIRHELNVVALVERIIRETGCRVDFIYCRYRLLAMLSGVRLAKRGIPQFIEYNDSATVQLQWGARSGLWRGPGKWLRSNPLTIALIRWTEAVLFRRAAGVIAITAPLRNYVRSLAPEVPVVVIGNGSDPTSVRPLDKTESRRQLGLDLEGRYFVHVGTLTCWDGLDRVLEAWAELDDDQSPARHLFIVGKGHDEEHLQRLAADLRITSVTFVGELARSQALTYLGAADVGLLLKTIDEYGLSPIKLYEYMAAGRPIIASDIDDINIVGDLGIGATVPMPLEREALKETIRRFLSMPADQLDAMGQRAREILCERFTWDKRGDQILGWVHENLP